MIISRIVMHQPAGLLRLLTDGGLEGRCTGIAATVSEADVAEAASILLNANPVDRERIWLAFNQVDGRVPAALRAGIDVALWDLAARAAGQPVYQHVNGFRSRIPVCWRGAEHSSAEGIVEEAREAQRRPSGFDNLDFHFQMHGGVRLDDQCVATAQLPDYPIGRIYIGRWIAGNSRTLWDMKFSDAR